MVFVPFTEIDNHLKCVNFGSRMLLREDTEAYTWILTSFMIAHEKQPTMVVTNQDGAMKKAIEAVPTESTHRLCTWHIMQKVPAKICPEIYDETDFKEHFGKLVWNMFMEPLEFEGKRSKLVEDFGLQNHKWMTKMFDLRHIWLLAYFIHSPLFGLMRTTSRSESENTFFKNFTNHGSTLVNFMMCFESAIERQCYRQEVLDFKTFDSTPKLHTKLTIEIHACKVYTRTISLLIQKEIYEGCWACQIQEFKKEEGCEIVKVVRNLKDGSVECTCRHFLRYRFLCRRVFCVLKNCNIEVIPERYILRRWRRDLMPPALRRNTNRYREKDKAIEKLTNEANFVVKVPNPPSKKMGDVIEDIYAIKKPKQNLEIYEGCWACQIQEFKKEEGCEIVKVRYIRAGAYRTLYKEEGKETVIQEKDKVVNYKVVRNPEDGSVECTCRHFLRYGDLIPPALRRNTNRYGEKDEAIEKLTNEVNFVVDECLFLLRKDKEQLKQFVENLENIKKEIQVKVPNLPYQKMGDVIEDIYAIKKPKQNLVNNPQKASNKGGRRGERIKSGREIAMKAKAKRAQKYG
nr:hypothetical protein [Tanacetum cinerariifolium]